MKPSPFNKLSSLFSACIQKRNGGILLFLALFLGFQSMTRIVLMIKAAQNISWDVSLAAALGWGFIFDIGIAAWVAIPFILLLTLLPKHFFERLGGAFCDPCDPVGFSLCHVVRYRRRVGLLG